MPHFMKFGEIVAQIKKNTVGFSSNNTHVVFSHISSVYYYFQSM